MEPKYIGIDLIWALGKESEVRNFGQTLEIPVLASTVSFYNCFIYQEGSERDLRDPKPKISESLGLVGYPVLENVPSGYSSQFWDLRSLFCM